MSGKASGRNKRRKRSKKKRKSMSLHKVNMLLALFLIGYLWMVAWTNHSQLSVLYSSGSLLSSSSNDMLDQFHNLLPKNREIIVDNQKHEDVTLASKAIERSGTKKIKEKVKIPKELLKKLKLDVYKSKNDIPVFYNVFVNNEFDVPRVRNIVTEQFKKLQPIHKPVYVNSIGTPLDFNSNEGDLPPLSTTENPVEILKHYETAAETVTLKALWEFCRMPENENRKVVYLHSKGSYTPTPENNMLRRFLTVGALSDECATMPKDSCNVCASRFSPVPHPHISGNMWLARCDYVKRLIDPNKFEDAMDRLNYDGGEAFLACDGRGRYSAEHWVLSHPSVKPCDLYTDPTFTWNYDGIPSVKKFRRRLELKPAPRFELGVYLKTKVRYCTGRGASENFRRNEYMGLYNETIPSDWWGRDFFKEEEGWWPYRDVGWVQLPEHARQELIKFGFNHHLWESRHRPYKLWGKTWQELSVDERRVFVDIFAYDEESWNDEAQKEKRDKLRVDETARDFEPNLSFDRCNIGKDNQDSNKNVEPWYNRKKENKGRPLQSFVYETTTKPPKKKRLLIIAAVPRSETHFLTLWSELECFTEAVDHVIISAPEWSDVYIEHVVSVAKKHIPHFRNNEVTIEAKYFVNNRYDVGLWCDAYESLGMEEYDEYGLINDSVFALRKFSAIFDNIEYQNVSMTSLSYSYTHKWNAGYGPEAYWVESVYRAFDKEGIIIFNDYSCVPEDDPKFCPEEDNNKACIINNFEHDLVKEYPCDKVAGIYPGDSAGKMRRRDANRRTWIKNTRYWRLLVDHMGFPIAKANEPEQVGAQYIYSENKVSWENNPLLKTCTIHIMNRLDELFDRDLPSFKMAKPYYLRRWSNIPPKLQALATANLGYTESIWNNRNDSPILAGKKWKELTRTQQQTLHKFGCTMLSYNQNGCHSATVVV